MGPVHLYLKYYLPSLLSDPNPDDPLGGWQQII